MPWRFARVPKRLPRRQSTQDVSVIDVVDPLPHRLLILSLENLLGALGDVSSSLAFVHDVKQEGDVRIVLTWTARNRSAEMVARIRQKLAILIENRVGPQAGLKDISRAWGIS